MPSARRLASFANQIQYRGQAVLGAGRGWREQVRAAAGPGGGGIRWGVADHERLLRLDAQRRARVREDRRIGLAPTQLEGQHEGVDVAAEAERLDQRPDVEADVAHHRDRYPGLVQRREGGPGVAV